MTQMQHMFTFIVPMSSIKSPLSQHDSVPKTFSQRTFSKLGQTSSSTFLHIRKENISCIVCCEVFLLRVVLGFVGGGGGNGLCLSFFPRSAFIFVPTTHNNKHSSNPAQSLGQIIVFKPQESSLRKPPPEFGLYIGIHLFANM